MDGVKITDFQNFVYHLFGTEQYTSVYMLILWKVKNKASLAWLTSE